jgi:CMP-N,N'-diacetyllegionaminic acid synthase
MAEKQREILAVIPARAGSKGIPNKNIRPFAGKPLLVHSINAAKNAPSVGRIIVSTDSEEIAMVAKAEGAEVPFLRPAELATSDSKVVDAVINVLDRLKEGGYESTHLLLLQPTSPLRTSDDIEAAVKLFFEKGADSLVSVCRTENVLMTKDANSTIHFENQEMLSSPNRQELPAYYKFDGSMIYLVDTQKFRDERSFFAGKLIGFEIPRWRSIDVDEPQDFVLGELIFNHRKELQEKIENFISYE